LRSLPEVLRFPRGLRAWVGFNQTGIPYERDARKQGSAKYTIAMLYKLGTDGIASMSTRVLQITQLFTFLFAVVSLGLAGFALWHLFFNPPTQPMVIWFIIGYLFNTGTAFVTMFALYILSAYIGRTYLEIKRRPCYVIYERLEGPSREG